MPNTTIPTLLQCIQLEDKAQQEKYSINQIQTLKQLKADGLAIHPIIIKQKSYGYEEYPEVEFDIPYSTETRGFRAGGAIELFWQNEQPAKAVLLELQGKKGSIRLLSNEYPDWIDDHGVGIKLAPDQYTTQVMKAAVLAIEKNKRLLNLYNHIHGLGVAELPDAGDAETYTNVIKNKTLNQSQIDAVHAIANNKNITIIHGPPGTGKTTTLVAAIQQLIANNEKLLVTAPSNTAVDHIAMALAQVGVAILRVGNTAKVHSTLLPHTPEGKLNNTATLREVKLLKRRADDFRKMATKYKRKYGKAEQEQRKLLYKEVKEIRNQIIQLQRYNEEKLYNTAQVILGTPVGLQDDMVRKYKYGTVLIDEAGQCLEPLAWAVIPLANKIVLAGDALQLPPTVLHPQAVQLGFGVSILEHCIQHIQAQYLLNVQYRMRAVIAGYSSAYFYGNKLTTPIHLNNIHGQHLTLIDTAGAGYQEARGKDGNSLHNEGELQVVLKLISLDPTMLTNPCTLITPYNGQVALATTSLPSAIHCSTIDSYQGQEAHTIIISLVRSNDDGIIGFLKDYRRMNVAITRAKERLIIIGDSATVGGDDFFNKLITYVQENGCYKSVWEYDML